MEKLKLFEAFAGVGTQRMALDRLGIPYESVGIAEIDKFALQTYEAVHGDLPNYGDISQVNVEELPDMDLFTYSFPCQDISLAGSTNGLAEGSGTRSSLLWECRRVIQGKKPKYLLMENVKNLVGKKFKADFDRWLEWLESEGYTNYWKVLNAKNYGVPQNRERVFVVSILGEHVPYVFPEEKQLQTKLKDVLEPDVDGKYILSDTIQERFRYIPKVDNDVKTLGTTKPTESTRSGQRDVVFSDEGIMGALCASDYKQPKQIVQGSALIFPSNTKKGWDYALPYDGFNYSYPTSKTRRGRVGREVSQTILTTGEGAGVISPELKIRKLTPLECWRLMGIQDSAYTRAVDSGVSDSQLYKQAGNAIVVDVLVALFAQLEKTK